MTLSFRPLVVLAMALLHFLLLPPASAQQQGLPHPLPSYAHFTEDEMDRLCAEVRQSRPSMHRGGWQWDRLLRRYIDGERKEKHALRMVNAYFMSMLERYEEAKKEGKDLTLFHNHQSWGSGGRMRIFEELVRQQMLTADERQAFETLVLESLKTNFPDYAGIERGANNRPYGINGGPAIAVRLFRDHPNAQRHQPWLDALWRELIEYGDTTETNYYPYGPLYLTGLLDMAEGMGKFNAPGERAFLFRHAMRYAYYVHGGGVRGNPNSGVRLNLQPDARKKLYADPWNNAYIQDEGGALDTDVWYRFAQEYECPEFLWAAEQACLGGRPPEPMEVPAEYLDAYNRRFAWFVERGINPAVPKGGAAIGYYSEHKHKVPERLYLCSDRESGKPFASFYIFDRNNNYMHYCDDSDGKLYEYCADGAKFLHTSGKYTSGRAGVGEGAYDMLTVLPPDMAFPMNEGSGMGAPTHKAWKTASMSIKLALPSREGPDSKNWKFDPTIGKFRRTDEPELGFSHGNMDGYWGLNDDYHLTSIYLGEFSHGACLQNVRLSGPKGEKILASMNAIPDNLRVELVRGDLRTTLKDSSRKEALHGDENGRRGGPCLKVNTTQSEAKLALTLVDLDERFNGTEEYTRVSFDVKGEGGGLVLNGRTNPRYFTPFWHRGGILRRDHLRAENKGDDSFGQFTMRNYYGANSQWTRQSVLTAEGYFIVRDVYAPCMDVDGYHTSPCWSIVAEGEPAGSGQTWFDAPARDHAWWQKQKKRVLLWMHPQEGFEIGHVEHRTSQDIGGGNVRNTFSKTTVRAGQPIVWLSVLRPFNEGEEAAKVAATIETALSGPTMDATVKIGNVRLSINHDGRWMVQR